MFLSFYCIWEHSPFPFNLALQHSSCPSYFPSLTLCPLAVTPFPFIPYHHPPLLLIITSLPLILPYIPLLSCLPLSSCWLCMLPHSGLCRGRLERLRCSGGDWQCSRHHTQPGRKIVSVYNSVITSSCSPTATLLFFLPSHLSSFPSFLS